MEEVELINFKSIVKKSLAITKIDKRLCYTWPNGGFYNRKDKTSIIYYLCTSCRAVHDKKN